MTSIAGQVAYLEQQLDECKLDLVVARETIKQLEEDMEDLQERVEYAEELIDGFEEAFLTSQRLEES